MANAINMNAIKMNGHSSSEKARQEVVSAFQCTYPDQMSRIQVDSSLLADWQIYRQKLTEDLKTKTLAPIKKALMAFAYFYHFCSVALGFATVILLSLIFSGASLGGTRLPLWLAISIGIIVMLLLLGILILIETNKMSLAQNVFRKVVKRASPSSINIVALIGLTLFSMAISCVGGVCITYYLNDESKEIINESNQEISKVSTDYDRRIQQNEAIVANLNQMSTNSKQRRWGLLESEKLALEHAQNEIKRLSQERASILDALNLQKNSQLKGSHDYLWQAILITAGLVILFELITIYAHYYRFQYYAIAEREAVHLGYLPSIDKELLITNKVQDSIIGEPESKDQVDGRTKPNTISAIYPKPIGYQIPKNKPEITIPPRGPVIDYNKVQDCLDKGMTVKQTAIYCHCSESSVRKYKRENY